MQMFKKLKPTHIQYKGTSLEKKVQLLVYCHNSEYAMVAYKSGGKPVKVHISTLTEITAVKGQFWRNASKYLLDTVVPIVIGFLGRKIIRK